MTNVKGSENKNNYSFNLDRKSTEAYSVKKTEAYSPLPIKKLDE